MTKRGKICVAVQEWHIARKLADTPTLRNALDMELLGKLLEIQEGTT